MRGVKRIVRKIRVFIMHIHSRIVIKRYVNRRMKELQKHALNEIGEIAFLIKARKEKEK